MAIDDTFLGGLNKGLQPLLEEAQKRRELLYGVQLDRLKRQQETTDTLNLMKQMGLGQATDVLSGSPQQQSDILERTASTGALGSTPDISTEGALYQQQQQQALGKLNLLGLLGAQFGPQGAAFTPKYAPWGVPGLGSGSTALQGQGTPATGKLSIGTPSGQGVADPNDPEPPVQVLGYGPNGYEPMLNKSHELWMDREKARQASKAPAPTTKEQSLEAGLVPLTGMHTVLQSVGLAGETNQSKHLAIINGMNDINQVQHHLEGASSGNNPTLSKDSAKELFREWQMGHGRGTTSPQGAPPSPGRLQRGQSGKTASGMAFTVN